MKNIITTTENVSLQMFKPVHGIYQHLTKGVREEDHEIAMVDGDVNEELSTRTEVPEQIEPSMRTTQVPVAEQIESSMRTTQATVVKKSIQNTMRHTLNSARPWSTIKDVDADTKMNQNNQNEEANIAHESTVQSRFENSVHARVDSEAHSETSSQTQAKIITGEVQPSQRISSTNGEDKAVKEQPIDLIGGGDEIHDSKLQKVEKKADEVKRPSVPVNAFVGDTHGEIREMPVVDLKERNSNLQSSQAKSEMADRVEFENKAVTESKSLPDIQSEMQALSHGELVERLSDSMHSPQIGSSKLQREPARPENEDEMNMTRSESFEEQLATIKNSLQSIGDEPRTNESTDVGFNELSPQNAPIGLEATNKQSDMELRKTEIESSQQIINPRTTIEDAALERTHDRVLSENLESNDKNDDTLFLHDREDGSQQSNLNEKDDKQFRRESFENRELPQPKLNTAFEEQKDEISKPVILDERLVVQRKGSVAENGSSSAPNASPSSGETVSKNAHARVDKGAHTINRSTVGPTISEHVSAGSESFGAEQISTVVSMEGFSAHDSSMILESTRPVNKESEVREAPPLKSSSEKSLSKSDVQKIFESLIRDAAEQNGLEV